MIAQMAGGICGAGLVKDCRKLHSRCWAARRIRSVQISASAQVWQQKSSELSSWFTWSTLPLMLRARPGTRMCRC
ncbi:hypothetical protein MPTK2_Ug00280 [Marchantia polymorpha subsp. ruderalis]